jgi:hypothetical protein
LKFGAVVVVVVAQGAADMGLQEDLEHILKKLLA